MTTLPKRIPRPAVSLAAKDPASGHDGTARPFLRFHHSVELREKTERTLVALESAADVARHRDVLAEPVVEFTSAGDGLLLHRVAETYEGGLHRAAICQRGG
jgi:hypothetical protein